VADEQPADDLPERAQLRSAWLDQSGADVVPESEVAPDGFGVAGAGLRAALFVLGAGISQVGVVEPGAGEVQLLPSRRRVAFGELSVDEVEHRASVSPPRRRGCVRDQS
jgi:hypothetical protein